MEGKPKRRTKNIKRRNHQGSTRHCHVPGTMWHSFKYCIPIQLFFVPFAPFFG